MRITRILRIDWFAQTLLIAFTFVALGMDNIDKGLTIVTMLFFWQLISAVVMLVMVEGRNANRWTFLIIDILYILLFASNYEVDGVGTTWAVSIVLMFLIPAVLAGYWMLTTFDVFNQRTHNGNFLRHTSF